MQTLFGFIRANTAPGSVLLANLDGLFFLNTGRKTVRGFTPNGFDLFYAVRQSAATPDQLSNAIVQQRAGYVVLTPDLGLAESESFHRSVEALERGDVVEPVPIPGEPRGIILKSLAAGPSYLISEIITAHGPICDHHGEFAALKTARLQVGGICPAHLSHV